MPMVTTSRPATHAETAHEMDRRGRVIERLEAQVDALEKALGDAYEEAASIIDEAPAGVQRYTISAAIREAGRAAKLDAARLMPVPHQED